jgi:hypothetical protein
MVAATAGFAQTSLATLRGTMSDEQGGMLPGATVTARQIETNTTRTSVTEAAGQYFLPSLPAGTYEVTVELSTFATGRRPDVILRVGQAAEIDFVLKVGTIQESVTVTGQAALVETQHVVGAFIDAKAIENLPTVSRNFADLAQLAPGVTSTGGSSMGFSAAGQHQYQNNVFVDGATNAMQFYGTQAESFPQDWIQEFQVMTNGFSAEFGNASGAVLNVITRSGTNNIRGRTYGFFQNARFNSHPYAGRFSNGAPVFLTTTPPYNQRRLGGFLGGPIVPDKGVFREVAAERGLADLGDTRSAAWGDFDGDGHLDLYVGFTRRSGIPNKLYRNDGNGGHFTEVGRALGVDVVGESRQVCWIDCDYDNDGRPDLYVSSYIDTPVNERDYLFRNEEHSFRDVLPPEFLKRGATHGIQWADFNGDGALDLAMANNNPNGNLSLCRNVLPPARARRSVQVLVLDDRGRYTRAGSEVRIYARGTRTILGARIVDTGSGYCSQNAMPVHVGLSTDGRVDIEVTSLTRAGRKIARAADVDPNKLRGACWS